MVSSADENSVLLRDTHHFIEIEMLFDLRFSLCELENNLKTVEMLGNDYWKNRESDVCLREALGLTKEEWYNKLKENFIPIFDNVLATSFIQNIIPYTNNHYDMRRPGHVTRRVTINFPYGLPSKQILSELKEVLSDVWYGYYQGIYFVSIPPEKTTFRLLSSKYTDYFVYEWSRWLEYHHEEVLEYQQPSFRIHAPRLKPNSDLQLSEQQQKDLGEMDPFELISYIHLPGFALCWIDPRETYFYLSED